MNEQRNYNLNRPSHLIAGQVIRDIEAIAMVKFGPQSSGPIHRLVEQYQELLFERDQKNAEMEYQHDWPTLLAEFQRLVLEYRLAYENEEKDSAMYQGAGGNAWETLMSFFKHHVGTNAQGVPQSIVDAYEGYLKANDEGSDNEFRNARMGLIDAVGEVVNSQGEVLP